MIPLLLVLDNVEHLLPRAADDIGALVAATHATLLVTSRERLQLHAERV
jgi:predicted ATPase